MIMLLAFIAMLAGQAIFELVFQAIGSSNAAASEAMNIVSMIAFQCIYLAVYFVYTRKRGIRSSFSVGNKISVISIVFAVVIAVVCFFGFSGLSQLFEVLLSKTGYQTPGIEANSTIAIIFLAITTVLVAPVGEETIFRSALLSGVERTYLSDVWAAVVSGAMFAIMHINPSQTVYQFFLGASAAYVMLKCRNVIAAMIIHGISNLMAILLSFTDMGSKISQFYVMQIGHNAVVTVVFCALLPAVAVVTVWLICKVIFKTEKKKYPDKFHKKLICIDENTLEPVFDGEEDGSACTNKSRQAKLKREFVVRSGEKVGFFGNNTYEIAFGAFTVFAVILWLAMFVALIQG